MAAKKKSASRKSAAKKASPARKRPAAKKAPNARAKAKKRVPAPKSRPAARKKPAARRVTAPVATTEVDQRIAIVRANLRELVEQAASSAGAASEELMSQRIADYEEKLRLLLEERKQLAR